MLMVVDEDASDKNDDPATPGESNVSFILNISLIIYVIGMGSD